MVYIGRRVVAHGLQIVAFEYVEHLHDMHAARGGWRRGNNFEVFVGATHGLPLHHAVVGEVLGRYQAASGFHFGGDELCHLASVKAIDTLFADLTECPGQIRLSPDIANRVSGPVRLKELALCGGVFA